VAEGLGEGLGEGRAVGAEVEPVLPAGLSAPDGESPVELLTTTEDCETADTTGEVADTTGEAADTTGEAADRTGEAADTTGEAAVTTGEGRARGTGIGAAVGVVDATLVPVELLGRAPSAPVERVQPASDIIEAIKPRDAADSR